MAVDTSQFRNGLKIVLDTQPYVITYFQHVKPGKGGAFVRTKVKNLLNGKVLEKTFRSGEKVDEADIEERTMQYLYLDGDNLIFMDQETYDQLPFGSDVVGDSRNFLKENTEVDVLFWNGNAVNIELPAFVELAVSQTDPGDEGRHRIRCHEARHPRNRRHRERPPLRERGRDPAHRHPQR